MARKGNTMKEAPKLGTINRNSPTINDDFDASNYDGIPQISSMQIEQVILDLCDEMVNKSSQVNEEIEQGEKIVFTEQEEVEKHVKESQSKKRQRANANKNENQRKQKSRKISPKSSIKATVPKKPKRLKNPIPFVKIMTFKHSSGKTTKLAADAFNYREDPDIQYYFLSHFHSDHFYGITKKWNNGSILCSQITANLLQSQFKINPEIIVAIGLNITVEIIDDLFVTFLEANHCPGAVIAFFEYVTGVINDDPSSFKRSTYLPLENLFNYNSSERNRQYIKACENHGSKILRILHTGDFRANKEMACHKLLQNHRIDQLYLDTTYLDPRYSFPSQESVVSTFASFAHKLIDGSFYKTMNFVSFQKRITDFFAAPIVQTQLLMASKTQFKNNYLFCVGTYTIGKEKVAIALAKSLGLRIYANVTKRSIFSQFVNHPITDLITDDPYSTNIHLVPMRYLTSVPQLESYFSPYRQTFKNVIGVKPTGWTLRSKPSFSAQQLRELAPAEILTTTIENSKSLEFDETIFKSQFNSNKIIQVYEIPYSEHSSFREICMFLMCLNIGKVIPTVGLEHSDSISRMQMWIDLCLKMKEQRYLCLDDF